MTNIEQKNTSETAPQLTQDQEMADAIVKKSTEEMSQFGFLIELGIVQQDTLTSFVSDLFEKDGFGDLLEDTIKIKLIEGFAKNNPHIQHIIGDIKKYRNGNTKTKNAIKKKYNINVQEIQKHEETKPNTEESTQGTGENTEKDSKNTSESIEKRNDTTLGDELGEMITKKGPRPGEKNSCGASVGNTLSKWFKIDGLPTSGRDGKKRDENSLLEKTTGLSRKGKALRFIKVPVNTPYDARPGAIVVYNENAQLGTDKRKEYGHVEIVGDDGQFYSYYKSPMAGGSAKVNKKNARANPKEYRKKTGFTGYAYYPVYGEKYNDALAMINDQKAPLIA